MARKFDTWARKKLSDKEFLADLIAEQILKCDTFFNQPHEKLVERIMEKLEWAGEQYGNPKPMTSARIRNELEQEFIDIIGWELVRLWLKKEGKLAQETQ